MPIEEQALAAYLGSLNADQLEAVQAIRALIREQAPELVESIDEGKWFNGLITYSTAGGFFMYAVGPRSGGSTTFHMMPYYGSKELQERHGSALKPFLSGKSCIRFRKIEDVPRGALVDILCNGTSKVSEMLEAKNKRKPRVPATI